MSAAAMGAQCHRLRGVYRRWRRWSRAPRPCPPNNGRCRQRSNLIGRSIGGCCPTASPISSSASPSTRRLPIRGRNDAWCCASSSRPDPSTKPTTSAGSRTCSSTWRSTARRSSSRGELIAHFERRRQSRTATPTPRRATTHVYLLDMPRDELGARRRRLRC